MFEKFTERGRKVIIYAREEAEKRQNDYLGTEHLLLGLLREEESLPMVILKKDRKSTRLNSSHIPLSRMPSSA